MEVIERNSYFGTLCEWTHAGKDDLIENFKSRCQDTNNVPFVSYDQQKHVFILTTNNDLAIKIFANTFKSVLDDNREILKRKDTFDILAEELTKPLEGTALPEVNPSGNILEHFGAGNLIQVDNDSDEDSSTDNTSSGGVPSLYWSPQCGDISILSTETAAAITNLTNCVMYKEPESRRVRLIDGSIYLALEKLQRLEALLERIASHRASHASNVDVNLLSLSSQIPGTGVRYVSTTLFPHSDRLVAQPGLEDWLEHATIGEEYVWNQRERKHIISENLATTNRNIEAIPVRSSTLWTRFKVPTIGNPENAVPRTQSGSNSVVSGEKKASLPPPAAGPSKFLPLQDQARLREWSRNVDTGADPAIAAEQPKDPKTEADEEPTTRRVVEDSDSEAELQQESAPSNTRLIAVESDGKYNTLRQSVTTRTQPPMSQYKIFTAPDPEDRARWARAERANRYCDNAPVLQTDQHRQAAINVIGADSFFVGIPRDEDELEEPAAMQRKTKTTDTSNPQQSQSQPTEKKRPGRRGFGYDGAVDDADETNVRIGDEAIKPTPMSCRDPELQPYMPSNDFNSSKYGANRMHCRQHQNQSSNPASSTKDPSGRTSQRNSDQFSSGSPNQQADFGALGARNGLVVDNSSRPGVDRDSGPPSRRDSKRAKHQKQVKRLIEVENNATKASSTLPPPGLTIRQPSMAPPVDPPHILDSPLEEIQQPSLKPSWDVSMYLNEDTFFSASSSSGGAHQLPFDYTPQTKLVKPNINLMYSDTIARLKASKSMQPKGTGRTSATVHTSERTEEEDELESRKFYDTMNLKAPNPGQGKRITKGPAKKSAAQREERISATITDAYGPVPKAQPVKTNTPGPNNPGTPSKRMQQLAKSNPTMGAIHSDVFRSDARKDLRDVLVHRMRPMFEAARAFAGELQFECQIGNVLIMPSSLIKENKIYEPDQWPNIFNGTSISPNVKFNNVVTCNGSDIDNILGMKSRGNKAKKIWNKDVPGPSKMEFEFQCQDNVGRAFKLRFSVDGKHSVDEGPSTIGKSGIQCPGRTWDLCAVLGGISTWRYTSEDLESAITELVSSIHVNAEEAMAIHFRLPAGNALTVHDVVLRRISFHDYQPSEQDDIQLKVTESKLLYTRSHRVDKRLFFSFEKSHGNMAESNRVHYEVSVIHKDIAKAFEANKQVEVGELTSAETTGASLLTAKRASTLLNAALSLVDKIDWVGKCNYGTLVRRKDEREAQEQGPTRTMLPATHTNIVRLVRFNTGHSIAGPLTLNASRTNVGSRFPAPTPTVSPMHGIRAGTQAQVYEDASGNLFGVGQGGAKIPVIREDGSGVRSAEILPNDSASQIGRRPRVAKNTVYDAKPAGFW